MNNEVKESKIGTRGQSQAILKYFKSKKSLTSMQAFELFGCTRLAARVHSLREAGYDIASVWQETDTKYGEHTRYVKYVYKGKK